MDCKQKYLSRIVINSFAVNYQKKKQIPNENTELMPMSILCQYSYKQQQLREQIDNE